ncbi:hypothetical protein R4849_10610 [Acinetobacter baumannii]|uniref:hypothetical protein n=1 Tax=Acinetobacter baumannii TaxID=470 RepID=UPI0026496501|nr:hypothetical protein [Acinetobacter baumannii]MDV7643876.1 hypothetical protein [Acinetobacter baumannii]
MIELKDLTTIVALSSVMIAFLFTLTQISLKMRKNKFDEERNRIEIDILRRSLEDKVYKETEKLTATNERWSDVNHLLLDSVRKLDHKIDLQSDEHKSSKNKFLEGLGIENQIPIKNKAFVLTPFHPQFENTFDILQNACNKIGLNCSRGDEKFIKGGILGHILKEILEAKIIIANIDGRNPNVFYELGLAHALDKDVIIITSSIEEVPFDLKSQRLIIWKNAEDLSNQLVMTLAKIALAK